MNMLGIDYGKRKIGLALVDAKVGLAEPLKVIRYSRTEEVIEKIEKIVKVEKIRQVVIGISEEKMADETRKFAKKLQRKIKTPVVFQDETLTTKEAQELSIGAGIKRKKRKELEDAYAASLILQSYLDKGKVKF